MTALRNFLREAGGVATIESFLRWALHHPQTGYYAGRVRDIGGGGDFSTATTLCPALAQAVAAWAAARRVEYGWSGAWNVIELGPGGGQFAVEFLRALGGLSRRRLTYHLVEASPPLAERQRAALREAASGLFRASIQAHAKIEDALRAADGTSLIVSNEFVDAFPCAVFARTPDDPVWREVGIRWDDRAERAAETLLDVPAERAAELRASVTGLPASARRIEIHFAYRDWLRGWHAHWHRGTMLTIDYGDPVETLYHRRPGGTLRGFFRQQRVEGDEIFERAGHQDLTADINFTDLVRWGGTLDLRASPLLTQRDLILRWNPRANGRDPATALVLDPLGAGSAFKVLEQTVERQTK